MMKKQRGIGLMEVLVALVILAIAILGFAALQLRAVSASMEAGNNIHATNLARDLAERMRLNRDGFATYRREGESPKDVIGEASKECEGVGAVDTTDCNSTKLANYDLSQVRKKATDAGMQIAILPCQGSTLKRSCIYVSWDDTTATNGSGHPHCTNGTKYVTNAKCIIMETYNYD